MSPCHCDSGFGSQPKARHARSTCLVKACRGLTLIELVVVLGILAVLSTVAMRSLVPVADQARYESTQNLLNAIQSAIVGIDPEISLSTVRSKSNYLSDTGTFPTDLNDLLIRPVGVIDHTLQSFDSDRDTVDDINLTSGWNGPYLSLKAGATEILDGWGAAPNLVAASGSLTIQSLGSDGDSVSPEDGYRQDVELTIQPTDYAGTLVFRLYGIDTITGSRIDPLPPQNPVTNPRIAVLFYGINSTGGTSGAIAEQFIEVSSASSFEYRRENTIIGSTGVRAILWSDTNNDGQLDSGESIVLRSPVLYPTVIPRGETRIELELR